MLPVASRRRTFRLLMLVVGLGAWVAGHLVLERSLHAQTSADSKLGTIRFNRDIRPILSDKCFVCHGPDENERQAELRLDIREDAIAARGERPAIAPGQPRESEMIQRIFEEDPDLRMPPADSGRVLSEDDKRKLRAWIEQGAEYEPHWAYVPPRKTTPPEVEGGADPIDAFLLRRLAEEGWRFTKPADRLTLIRRLSFDLTGLPPTPEEVRLFLDDNSPNAYERVVDRLLASDHFGERMAIFWLDAVRYADTNGIHGDNHREHWLFREYVIDSFNNNVPFDVFTREQLAGDLLPSPSRRQLVASGYNRLNMTTREGGAQAKEYRAKYAADRVRNASTVWLGSTLGCSECHDHKFDPFSQKDFYSFAAFFADLEETAVGAQKPEVLLTESQQQQVKQLDEEAAKLQATLNRPTAELAAAQQKWEQQLRAKTDEWSPLKPLELKAANGTTLTAQDDQSVLAGGEKPDKEVYTIHTESPKAATGLRLVVLPHASAPAKGPGRAGNGNFVVTEVKVFVGEQQVKLAKATATHSQNGWPDKAAIDGNPDSGWAILPQVGQENALVLEAQDDLPAGPLRIELHQNHGRGAHTLAHFRIDTTTAPRPLRANAGGLPGELAAILKLDVKQRTKQQAAKLAAHYRSIAPALDETRKRLAGNRQQRKELVDSAPKLLIAKTMPTPRMTRVLSRGNWLDDSGEIVKPQTPSFLGELNVPDEERATRRELAEWIVDPENPLTARVYVNRLWALVFGEGIVRSLDDFGSQGDWPTHPELLDWLAIEFRESGWNTKAMLKRMVMTRAYRQSSVADAEKLAADPYNRLLGRQNRFRLPAEMIRDNALAVSGLLVHKVGGPSVKPYQPFGYWSHLNFPKRVYKPDDGENQYRRGLYTYWCRTFLHPSMLAFDAPSREECTVQRPRSNTPLAALVLLNDPTYVEAARVTAERLLLEQPDASDVERLGALFQLALQRNPLDAERAILLDIVAKHRLQYSQQQEEAAKLEKNGFRAASDEVDPIELAAWTSAVRVVFNLHEFVNRN